MEVKVPKRHVVSILGTDPTTSLPVLGAWNNRLGLDVYQRERHPEQPEHELLEEYDIDKDNIKVLEERVYELLARSNTDYVLPNKREHLAKAANSFHFDTNRPVLSNLHLGLLKRDSGVFDSSAEYFHPSMLAGKAKKKPLVFHQRLTPEKEEKYKKVFSREQAQALAEHEHPHRHERAHGRAHHENEELAASSAVEDQHQHQQQRMSGPFVQQRQDPPPHALVPDIGERAELYTSNNWKEPSRLPGRLGSAPAPAASHHHHHHHHHQLEEEDEEEAQEEFNKRQEEFEKEDMGADFDEEAIGGQLSDDDMEYRPPNTPPKFMHLSPKKAQPTRRGANKANGKSNESTSSAPNTNDVVDKSSMIMDRLRIISDLLKAKDDGNNGLAVEASLEILSLSQEIIANQRAYHAVLHEHLKGKSNMALLKHVFEQLGKAIRCDQHVVELAKASDAPPPEKKKIGRPKKKNAAGKKDQAQAVIEGNVKLSLNVSLSSSRLALSMMGLEGMPKFMYEEELLEDMISGIETMLKAVLSNLDAEIRSKSGGRKQSSDQEAFDLNWSELVLGHLESIVPMMQSLLGRVKLPDVLGLSLGRLLLDCFSANIDLDKKAATSQVRSNIASSLECVKKASLTLVSVIFADYPDFRDSLLSDIHTKCIRKGLKAQAQRGDFPKTFQLSHESSKIHMVSALILSCVQNAQIGRDERETLITQDAEGKESKAVLDSRTMRLRWADIVWQLVFEELAQSTSTKNGHVDKDNKLEWKRILQMLLFDILVCFGQLDFPCASLFLQRFTTLLIFKGLKHSEAFVRSICVEMLGEFMRTLMLKEKHWKSDQFICQDLETICESITNENMLVTSSHVRVSDNTLYEMMNMGDDMDGGNLIGSKELLQVAYEDLDAEERANGSLGSTSFRDSPHEACITVMNRAIDLYLDANLKCLEEDSKEMKMDCPVLIRSAKDFLNEMRNTSTPETASHLDQGQQATAATDVMSSLKQSNGSLSLAIHRQRAKRFDPAAIQKISYYLACTQTIIASRFGNFLDCLLDFCMADNHEIPKQKSDKEKEKADKAEAPTTNSTSVQVRSKAIKVLADLCAADDGTLGLCGDSKVHACLKACIQDNSISVREAAVELIAGLIRRSKELTMTYYDLLVHACTDPGSSVQKQAFKAVWEAYVIPPEFPRRLEAAANVIVRIPQMDMTVKAKATQIFRELWLTGSQKGDKNDTDHLVDTLWTIYVEQKRIRKGNASAVPLSIDNSMIHLLSCIFNADRLDLPPVMRLKSREKSRILKAGNTLCKSIVDRLLQAQGESSLNVDGNSEDKSIKNLLALHALLLAEPKLAVIGNGSKHYFIESLLPYLFHNKANNQKNGEGGDAVVTKSSASDSEELTCILSIIASNLSQVDVLGEKLATKLTGLLRQTIGSHDFLSVVAKACQLMCILCRFSKVAHDCVVRLANNIISSLRSRMKDPGTMEKSSAFLRRRLFVLGHLWRNSEGVLDKGPIENPYGEVGELVPILTSTLDCILYWLVDQDSKGNITPKQSLNIPIAIEALRALGMLIYSSEMVATKSEVKKVFEIYLKREANPILQVCALRALTEMIKKEESSVIAKQQQQLRTKNLPKNEKAKTAPLDTVCGEGEVSIAGTVLQYFWEKSILPLSVHIRNISYVAKDQESSLQTRLTRANRPLKLAIIELFESVLRQGLVAPWTAVPSLVALCVYPDAVVYQRACHLLKTYILEVRADFFDSSLIDAIQASCKLSIQISSQTETLQESCGKVVSSDMMQGVSMLYKMLQLKKPTRNMFLKALMRGFGRALGVADSDKSSKAGQNGGSGSSAAASIDLTALAFCANVCIALPYTVLDEPLRVLQVCNSLLFQEASYIESSLESLNQYADDIKQQKEVPLDLKLLGKKAAALSLVLEIKRVLKKVYSISENQIMKWAENFNKRSTKDSNKRSLKKPTTEQSPLDVFNGVEIGDGEHAWVFQCKTFKKYLKQDGFQARRYVEQMPSPGSTSEGLTPNKSDMDCTPTPTKHKTTNETPDSAMEPAVPTSEKRTTRTRKRKLGF